MKSTTTAHWNTGEIAREHNQRDEELCSRESHIDLKNEHGKSFHEVLYRSDLTEKYREIFGQAIDDYNAKQKRADRRLTVESYMQSIVDDNRGKKQTQIKNGKRVIKEDSRQGKQLSYEITFKVGNTERLKDENGRTVYDETGHHIRPEELPRIVQQYTLRSYAKNFQKRNPNLLLVNVDLHCDEGFYNSKGVWEYAADGLHIEVIPVADGFQRGLSKQNSMNKAMKEMGFTDSACYEKWAEREQDYLAKLASECYAHYCKVMGIEDTVEFYHPVRERSRTGGRDKEDFIREQELDESLSELSVLSKSVADREQGVKDKENELAEREKALAEKEAELVQRQAGLDEREAYLYTTFVVDELQKVADREQKVSDDESKLAEERETLSKIASNMRSKVKAIDTLKDALETAIRRSEGLPDMDSVVQHTLDHAYVSQGGKMVRATEYLEGVKRKRRNNVYQQVEDAQEMYDRIMRNQSKEDESGFSL